MTMPARNTLAIVGAGPVGLEAAAAAVERGFDVHVFERGEPGAHVLAWGHLRLFTPWSANLGPASARLLARHGWTAPPAAEHPTGAELVERCLAPLATTPELGARVHAHAQVVHVGRRATLPGEDARADQPFRLLVRDAGGRENFLHAFAVLDASGTYGTPCWAGTGGIPARGELYLAPQMSYYPDDVRGLRRSRHAGRRTLVIGGGASAATTVCALAQLAAEEPGTSVLWVTRERDALAGERAHDPLPARSELFAQARALRTGDPAVTWVGGAEVEGFEYNSATHQYRVTLDVDGQPRVETVAQVIVNTGYAPDSGPWRELRVELDPVLRAPVALAAALHAAGAAEALPAGDAETLAHPEPGLYVVGAKSYGRHAGFELAAGFAQVGAVVDALAARLGAAR